MRLGQVGGNGSVKHLPLSPDTIYIVFRDKEIRSVRCHQNPSTYMPDNGKRYNDFVAAIQWPVHQNSMV
jgi:hypothetical protein